MELMNEVAVGQEQEIPIPDKRITSLPARAVISMDDYDYAVRRVIPPNDPDLSRRLYQYVVTSPLREKLVKRAQLKHLRAFSSRVMLP